MTGDVPTGRGLVCSPPHGYPYGGDLPRGDLDVGRLPRGNGNLDVLTVTVGRPSPFPFPMGGHPPRASPSPGATPPHGRVPPWVPTARPWGTLSMGTIPTWFPLTWGDRPRAPHRRRENKPRLRSPHPPHYRHRGGCTSGDGGRFAPPPRGVLLPAGRLTLDRGGRGRGDRGFRVSSNNL